MKKLVIFDLDGTLLNTIADLAQSTNHALQALGYPTHDTSAYPFMVGNGINKLFERALPEGEKTQENVLRVRAEFIPYYTCKRKASKSPWPPTNTRKPPRNSSPTTSPASVSAPSWGSARASPSNPTRPSCMTS